VNLSIKGIEAKIELPLLDQVKVLPLLPQLELLKDRKIPEGQEQTKRVFSSDYSFHPYLINATGTPIVKKTLITRIKIPIGVKISTPSHA
tara:strand:- start:720 stop:989 length:270 start_codon:yes stop_codon:yes gene_type:complete